MKAYLHKNWCGLGDRVIVHPKGLPPGWTESNLTQNKQQEAFEVSLAYGHLRGNVLHLNPDTLDLIETFPVQ